MIENNQDRPRFYQGPHQEEFSYVRDLPPGRIIASRELFLDQLLSPPGNALVWGLGVVGSIEVAESLGLPLNTPLYAIQADVAVFPSIPPGYFVADGLPPNVALVAEGPQGPMILFRRLPPGTVIAYQPLTDDRVLNECLVVPPPTADLAPAPVTFPSPAAPVSAPASPLTSVAATGSPSTVVYDANGKVVGVVIIGADGRQEFVPTQ